MSSSRKYWVMAARNSEALLYTDLVSEQLPYTVSLCHHKTQISVIPFLFPRMSTALHCFLPMMQSYLSTFRIDLRTSLLPLLPVSPKFNKTVGIFPIHLFFWGGGVIVFTNNSTQPFQTLLFKKSRYFADKYIFILTWQERHHDQEGEVFPGRGLSISLWMCWPCDFPKCRKLDW